ncbi:MAG: tetratricopeptide repeat protein [Elusimicrobiota bacterium]
MDDDGLIALNTAARGLGWPQLKWAFSHYVAANFAPLTWLSYGLDYRFWGLNPLGYHLTNLLLHTVNAVLFYRLAKLLFGLSRPSAASREGALVFFALCAALLFAVHPLRVESVAWAAERRDVLSGFFYLCTLLLYLRAARNSSEDEGRGMFWLLASLAAYACSLLSKGIGITLPAVLLLLDVYPLRRIRGAADLVSPKGRRLLAEKLPYAALAVAVAVIGIKGQGPVLVAKQGLTARLVQSFFGLFFYLCKTVWPFHLLPIYERPLPFNPLAFPFLPGALIAAASTAALWRKRGIWPATSTAWTFYVVALLPVLGLVQFGPQIAADRYTYLSTLGFALLAGGSLLSLWDGSSSQDRTVRLLLILLPVAVLSGLAALTWRQARLWRDSESLWSYTLARAPESSVARAGLGDALMNQGRVDEALGHYREAIRINPDLLRVAVFNNSLGLALAKQGKFPDAVMQFRRAIAQNPDYAEAHSNLGAALAASGALVEAVDAYRAGLRLDPTNINAACSLGFALAAQGKWEEADGYFRRALAASPDPARLYESLRLGLVRQGVGADALRLFRMNVFPDGHP